MSNLSKGARSVGDLRAWASISTRRSHENTRQERSDMTAPTFLDVLEELIDAVIEPAAADVDASGTFPRAAMTDLGKKGLLGLTSATDVGGMGLGLADAALVVRRIAASCGSTAMVLCMHYCATAAIEAHGPEDTRRAIAAGTHLSTLAFSEAGSRSHFWAPLS